MKLSFWMAAPKSSCKFSDDKSLVSIDRDKWSMSPDHDPWGELPDFPVRPSLSKSEVLQLLEERTSEEEVKDWHVFRFEISDQSLMEQIMLTGFDFNFENIPVVEVLELGSQEETEPKK